MTYLNPSQPAINTAHYNTLHTEMDYKSIQYENYELPSSLLHIPGIQLNISASNVLGLT